MLTKFFDSSLRIQELRGGPSGGLLEGFAQDLCKAGYAEITARRHIRAAEHFIYWASRKRAPIAALNEESVQNFVHHLDRCRCPQYGRTHKRDLQNGARLFFGYLRRVGAVAASVTENSTEDPALVISFARWMRQHRGTCDATLYNYRRHLRDLLKSLGTEPSTFDAQKLRQFVLEASQQRTLACMKTCTTAVRMFVRFLISEGKCPTGLDSAIPTLARWRLSSLPRYIQPDEVERIIASCDPDTPVGCRDHAILLVLARLGLRAGDIVQLRLSDLNWEQASIRVSGKSRCQALLPLTQEIGNAIATYIKDFRPRANADTVFVRSRAPYRALGSHAAVSVIVAQAMGRAGVICPSRGAAHVLRHSIASSMLRQGASLQEIATILRHRSIATTEIYAKVDVVALGEIAQPWPEVTSC